MRRFKISRAVAVVLNSSLLVLIILSFGLSFGCSDTRQEGNGKAETGAGPITEKTARRPYRVLYVDSYHATYEHSMMIQKAVRGILDPAGVEMRVAYLDAKRRKSEKMLHLAALKARAIVENWHPDLVIAADDAASQYLVMPYYRNADLPFVFIGVNWDPAPYGFPCGNVTGQVEVELMAELLAELRKHARGDRIGMLGGDTLTDRKSLQYYHDMLHIHFDAVRLVEDFAAWKEAYLALQRDVDILLVRNNAGIAGWNDGEATAFILAHAAVPSGTVITHMSRYAMIDFSKEEHEMGQYAANTALQILAGTSPADIALSTNKQAKVYLNMTIARKLGIKFPMELIERAVFVKEAPQ